MFSTGDKIAYPMHGAGIIEGIEEKKILGEVRQYYILRVPYGDMKIMIPVGNSEEIGVRAIISRDELREVLAVLSGESTSMPSNWNRRNRENLEKLKTGDLFQVAAVIRNLVRIDREKRLSTGEKKMLNSARQILISEMVLVTGMNAEQAEEEVLSRI
ncbi:MAG: CarD family transcriptional regulator [Bacillota bacterium]|nr:CarD family transcriptional regulator [Bacillota bacterium]